MSAETNELKIGDRVRATMNGEDWRTGKFVEESETFARYGVLRDGLNEVRFFINAEKINDTSYSSTMDTAGNIEKYRG